MGSVRAVLVDAVLAFNWFVLGYFLALNSTYLVLTIVAALDFGHHLRRAGFTGQQDLFESPLTPPVSVLVPAYNEQAGIVESVHAMLALRYPEFEIVVVDDGSTDDTFELMRAAFDLVEVPRVIPDTVPTIGRVLSTHQPRDGSPLLVVRKENAGRRSDPLNVAINAAQYPLIVMVDADSLLDPSALLRVAQPFVDDPRRVVATGGVVRAANGSLVSRGRIVRTLLPKGWLARIQVVEYLRSFLLGPVVEVLGVIVVPLSFVLGIVNLPFAIAFALVAVGYGVLLSIAAVAVEEFSYHRYSRWRDLLIMAAAAAVENLGFRQLHAWWRLGGLVGYLRRSEHAWGAMPRTGFASAGVGEDGRPPP